MLKKIFTTLFLITILFSQDISKFIEKYTYEIEFKNTGDMLLSFIPIFTKEKQNLKTYYLQSNESKIIKYKAFKFEDTLEIIKQDTILIISNDEENMFQTIIFENGNFKLL